MATQPEETPREAPVSASVPAAPADGARPAQDPAPADGAAPGTDSPFASDEDLEAQLAFETIKRKREAKRRKRLIVIGVLVLAALIAAVVWIVSQAGEEDPEETYDPLAATAQVYRDDFATTITANGATEPLESTVVTPEVEGIIENLKVVEGQKVKEGDVLFTVKNEELDKAVREASDQMDSAQRAANSADSAVDAAYAAYNNAWNASNASGDWTDFDEADLRSGIDSAEDAYAEALTSLESAREALAEAEANADKRTVRAPVTGTIVALNVQEGASTASASESSGPLVQISDLNQMKVTVEVNEVDIASIEVGQKATATFSALPDVELEANVQRIASVSSGDGEGGGVVTYAVDLLIPEPDPALKPGMTASVTITTQSVPDALIVPTSALADDSETTTVSVVTDPDTGEMKNVEVKVIEKNNSEAAVSPDGELADGDLVLLGGGMGAMGDMEDMGNMGVSSMAEEMYETSEEW